MRLRAFWVCICFGVLIAAPQTVLASDCPDFELPANDQQAFCAEFEALLYAPYTPGSDRNSNARERKELDALLGSNPLWGEVYRSDPKQTLDLINRIRAAGGLSDD